MSIYVPSVADWVSIYNIHMQLEVGMGMDISLVLGLTYIGGQLVLEELQVEVEVRLGHGLVAPACKLGQYARRHVDNEAILAVKQVQERAPDALLQLAGSLVEQIDTRAILLQQIVQQHEYILNCRVLGQMRDQIQQRLYHLRGVLCQIGGARFVQRANCLKILLADHLRLHIRRPVDRLGAYIGCLLLQHRSGSNHVCECKGTCS